MEGTFHRFVNLPYDIRHYIYTLATLPRVVRPEEGPLNPSEKKLWYGDYNSYYDYAYHQFCKELLNGSLNMNFNLHPDIAHFAHNWWPLLKDWPSTQQSLDAYGFTSSRPIHEPWEPSEDTPRIPTEWLIESRELAFALTHTSCLYSNAEIPAFLHVCVESRQALMKWGYRLFFSTRTAGPRTWFNPSRDRLYIPYIAKPCPLLPEDEQVLNELPMMPYPSFEPSVLFSGCYWEIGAYSVQDMKAVKKVIFEAEVGVLNVDILARCLAGVLPLFSNVEELFLEDWPLSDFEYWFKNCPGAPILPSHTATSIHCIPVEDIDVVGSVFWSEGGGRRRYHSYTGPYCEHLRSFKATSSEPYHAAKAKELEARLLAWKSRSKLAQRADVRIPTIHHVHLVPDACAELYMNSRHGLWKAISSLTDEEIREPKFKKRFSKMNVFPLPFKIQWSCVGRCELGWPELLDDMQRMVEELTDPVTDLPQLQAWCLMNRRKITEPRFTSL
jgi:hypothetical protein